MRLFILLLTTTACLTTFSCKKNADKNVNTDPATCCGNGYVWTAVGTDSIFIANAFTPNGDGMNDLFSPIYSDSIRLVSYEISNETSVVFSANNDYWIGTDSNGDDMPEGTYNYSITVTSLASGDTATFTGKVCLLRDGFCPQNKSTCIYPAHYNGFDNGLDTTWTQYELVDCP